MNISAFIAKGTTNNYAATAVIVDLDGENFIATCNHEEDAAAIALAVLELKNVNDGDDYYIFVGADDFGGGVIFLTYTDDKDDEVKRRFDLEKKYSVQIAQKLFDDINTYVEAKLNA